MNPPTGTERVRFRIAAHIAVGVLAIALTACQGTSTTRAGHREGETLQTAQRLSPHSPAQTPPEEAPGAPWNGTEPEGEWPPAPFDAPGALSREKTFWDQIDFGGSVEVEGIWGENLPYRHDHYGRSTLQLDASYPKDASRVGVVIRSRRSWYP